MPRTPEMMAKEEMDSWGIAEFYSINCKREQQAIFSDSYNNSRNTWTNKHSSVA